MKILLVIALVFTSSLTFAQKIKFKISNHPDTTVNLVRYFGKGLYYADTAEMKNGIVEFDGSKQKNGILALFLPDQKLLEFVFNSEEVNIESTYPDLMGTAKVKKSEENKIFSAYVTFINTERKKASVFADQLKKQEKGSEEYENLKKKISETTDKVVAYQQSIVDNHWDKLVSRIVKMSMDIEIPDPPKDENGVVLDSNFSFNYFRDHYFDNFDFNDDRLVRTPIFHTKMANYFSKEMMFQHCDTVIKYAYGLCDALPAKSETYQYTVSWITSNFEKSKIMNMDKVFVRMAERYYCPKDEEGNAKAFWVPEKTLKSICEKAEKNENLVFGLRPPNIILRDSTDVAWKDFYSLESEYTILYFWDPECGHCKKITPKLQTLYEKKFRERNIEIFAVGKAVGDDFDKWKAFIKKHNLEFTNVAVTDRMYRDAMDSTNHQAKLQKLLRTTTIQSLNYQQTYDIYTTPRVFVLDKDKKIIAKSLSIAQLEDLMDRLQGKSKLEKIFKVEEEKPEESKMH
jgi:thiol-disulfide isomerase/thioredoxin